MQQWYLVREAEGWMVLVHDPIGLDPVRNTPLVENQSLLGSNMLLGGFSFDYTILACDFPVSSLSCPISPVAICVLVTARTEEITLWVVWLFNC